ncbi:MAG TPA: DoxX family protein [Acidobacteriota bacterium]|nr:DoxX family protein [Acidobacteriota bacterium]
MHKLRQGFDWAEAHPKVWLDLVRIFLGLALFVRGLLLITNARTEFVSELVARSGQSWLLSAALLHYVTLAHFIGGIMLAFGILTRVAAAVQLPVLIGAVFFIHRGEGLLAASQSLELSALVLLLLSVITAAGAGPISVDGESRTRAELPPALPTGLH